MGYSNGNVGRCSCGQTALVSCGRCGRALCDVHASQIPLPPTDVSEDARGKFGLAVRYVDGPHCEDCRTEVGRHALAQASGAPRTELPAHWLDRAIALSSDKTRSDAEKAKDAALPSTLTATQVAEEFLRRIEKQPRESVPITKRSMLRNPEYVEGWTVNCRRTQYVSSGAAATRQPLPCLISVDGELLGPSLDENGNQGSTWWVVPESDIELPRLVTGVAQILVLSAFVKNAP